ncbi:FAD-binding oxidoreductase [Paenibacillus sp. SYP-B3998]|uniref:FAD-binding oxidoreductase n=1 Tax=Paenibacillus sp. SYP-B3998 TaxID=2678564 RepID=A0A6G3ZZ29_9BACL|nr:FAD-binding oxidoreductase [Paenibacillus sp. SYP-B3998]NEW06839.1 FAD-binding oxidoreductase [Paenibacillus sp. SYP-B3998]
MNSRSIENFVESQRLKEALTAWSLLLGPEHVNLDERALALANTATFRTIPRSVAILNPADRDEIAACLRIATSFRIPVYPVSAGHNWGYGSRVPVQSGSVLLSLARMNRILDYNEQLAFITVEPGVTFRHIIQFLQEQNSELLPPLSGASPDASLIGNVLEKGIGKGPYENMAARSFGYEVVLPSGDIVADRPDASEFGPLWQGLLHQSNLGVVTRMSLALAPAPQLRQQGVFLLADSRQLAAAINSLRSPLLRNPSHLQAEMMNPYRYLAQTSQFPYDLLGEERALSREEASRLLQGALGPGPGWVGNATLWADSSDELHLRAGMLRAWLEPLGITVELTAPQPGRLAPVDMTNPLNSAYWRKRQPTTDDLHPDRDGCGVIWITPTLPMLGEAAADFVAWIENAILGYGLEPTISLRFPDGRRIHAVVGLLYDRQDADMEARALRCHETVNDMLRAKGLSPYRLNLLNMEQGAADLQARNPLLTELKQLLDPCGILAPGKYIQAKEEPL